MSPSIVPFTVTDSDRPNQIRDLQFIGMQLFNGLIMGSIYVLLSLGLTIIFGMLGIINFAHGACYMFGAFVAYTRDFAQKHGGWIAARLDRLPAPAPFAHGTVLPLRGVDHQIVHRPGERGTVWLEVAGDERLLCVAGEEPHLARRIRDFLKREAKCDLEAASRAAAERLGVRLKRVSIRDQSSRWGSCSTTGVLSYSWRLVLAPPFVLDYLAAHEVAHLIEMNHSRRFWRLVERICPHLTRAKTWLDVNGTNLHRYGQQHGTRARR